MTVCGASDRISAPASISACDSSATADSSAVKRDPPRLDALVGDPRLRSAHRERALVVGGRQPVGGPGAALELGDRALVDDLARAHDPDPVADLLDLGHQVAREQHRHPLPRQPADQQAHVAHPAGIKPGGGLVEQQQLGLAQQRRGDPQALAHPVRVAADAIPRPVGELDRVQRGVDPRRRARRRRTRPAARGCAGPSGMGRTSAPRRTRPRPSSARTVTCGSRPNRRTDPSVGRIRPSIIRSDVVFPGAVGSEVPVDVAGVDGQVDAPDRGQVAVALDEPAHLYGRRAVNRFGRHSARAAASAAAAGTEPSTV